MKLQRMPPSLKERQRYIRFDVLGEEKFNKGDVLKAINKTGKIFFGELEFSRIHPWLIDYDPQNNEGVLKTNNHAKEEAKTILFLVDNIEGKPVRISCKKVSGTIKKVRE